MAELNALYDSALVSAGGQRIAPVFADLANNDSTANGPSYLAMTQTNFQSIISSLKIRGFAMLMTTLGSDKNQTADKTNTLRGPFKYLGPRRRQGRGSNRERDSFRIFRKGRHD